MQALESLNDTQVNDFLSGKTPLNLSMRLGDHMMLIQLQLSTANPKPNENGNSSVPNTTVTSSSRSNRSSHHHHHHHHHSHRIKSCVPQTAPVAHQSSASRKIDVDSPQSSVPLSEADIHRIKNKVVNSVNEAMLVDRPVASTPSVQQPMDLNKNTLATTTAASNATASSSSSTNSSYKPLINTDMEQSPIKSLSNLVSGPITMKNIPNDSNATTSSAATTTQDKSSATPATSATEPATATSTPTTTPMKPCCLCNDNSCRTRTSPNCNKYVATKIRERRRTIQYGSSPLHNSLYRKVQPQRQQQPQTTILPIDNNSSSTMSITDNMALAEASRNLTQTLRKLSKDVFCHKVDHHQHHHSHHSSSSSSSSGSSGGGGSSEASSERKVGSGAVIESMKNHGKGIYSGTFSGTLNPALQDRYGRPKRDISTVIHILNDLLSATPHYTRGAKFSLEPSLNNSGTMLHTKYRVGVSLICF